MTFKTTTFLFLLLMIAGLRPSFGFPQSPHDIANEIRSWEGLELPTHGGPGKAAEIKERALYVMYNYESEQLSNSSAASMNREYDALKFHLFQELWTTARMCSRNPILGLQVIIHYPATNWSPLSNMGQQDFFLWCLREISKKGLLHKDDARDYIDSCREHHPLVKHDNSVNQSIMAFIEKVAESVKDRR